LAALEWKIRDASLVIWLISVPSHQGLTVFLVIMVQTNNVSPGTNYLLALYRGNLWCFWTEASRASRRPTQILRIGRYPS
jgi:hypothetical protein